MNHTIALGPDAFYFAVVADEDGLIVWITPVGFFDETKRMADHWDVLSISTVESFGLRMVEDSQFEPEDEDITSEALEAQMREYGFKQTADFTARAFGV